MPKDYQQTVHIPIGRVLRGTTMHVIVDGYRGWLIRMKITLLLFRLGAWIAGVGIRVIKESDHADDDLPKPPPVEWVR